MTTLLTPQTPYHYNRYLLPGAINSTSIADISNHGLKDLSRNVDYISNFKNVFNPTFTYSGTCSTPTSSSSDTLFANISLGTFPASQRFTIHIAYTTFNNAYISRVDITNATPTTTSYTNITDRLLTFNYTNTVNGNITISLYHRNGSATSSYVSDYTISIIQTTNGDLPDE